MTKVMDTLIILNLQKFLLHYSDDPEQKCFSEDSNVYFVSENKTFTHKKHLYEQQQKTFNDT